MFVTDSRSSARPQRVAPVGVEQPLGFAVRIVLQAGAHAQVLVAVVTGRTLLAVDVEVHLFGALLPGTLWKLDRNKQFAGR